AQIELVRLTRQAVVSGEESQQGLLFDWREALDARHQSRGLQRNDLHVTTSGLAPPPHGLNRTRDATNALAISRQSGQYALAPQEWADAGADGTEPHRHERSERHALGGLPPRTRSLLRKRARLAGDRITPPT